MEIKVMRIEDGPARVEVRNPATGETVSCADVNVGQEVCVTTSDSPENPPYIGEVQDTATPEGSAETQEPGQPAAETGQEPGEGEGGTQEPGGEPVPPVGEAQPGAPE